MIWGYHYFRKHPLRYRYPLGFRCGCFGGWAIFLIRADPAQKRQAIGILSIIVDQRGEDVPVIPQAGSRFLPKGGFVSEKSREDGRGRKSMD